MKKNSPAQLGFKIVLLTGALFIVIYFINSLQRNAANPGGDNPLDLFVGGDVGRPLNWCPEKVAKLEIKTGPSTTESVTDPVQVQSYCQLLSEAFDGSKVDYQSFTPLIRAITPAEKDAVLEVDASGQVFRFQGLPFGSRQLSRQLGNKIQH
jgi:hypothetical protein